MDVSPVRLYAGVLPSSRGAATPRRSSMSRTREATVILRFPSSMTDSSRPSRRSRYTLLRLMLRAEAAPAGLRRSFGPGTNARSPGAALGLVSTFTDPYPAAGSANSTPAPGVFIWRSVGTEPPCLSARTTVLAASHPPDGRHLERHPPIGKHSVPTGDVAGHARRLSPWTCQ